MKDSDAQTIFVIFSTSIDLTKLSILSSDSESSPSFAKQVKETPQTKKQNHIDKYEGHPFHRKLFGIIKNMQVSHTERLS